MVASFFCTTFAPDFKNEPVTMKERLIQLLIAAIISLGGLVLLFCGEYIDPAGEIHETVLIAFGEAATFAGSIIGIDYHYKSKYENRNENHNPNP